MSKGHINIDQAKLEARSAEMQYSVITLKKPEFNYVSGAAALAVVTNAFASCCIQYHLLLLLLIRIIEGNDVK